MFGLPGRLLQHLVLLVLLVPAPVALLVHGLHVPGGTSNWEKKIIFRTFLCQINSLDDELHEPLLGVLRERRHALRGQGHGQPVLVVGLEKKPDKYSHFARNYFFKCRNVPTMEKLQESRSY